MILLGWVCYPPTIIISHSSSNYTDYKYLSKKDSDKADIFRKIEHYNIPRYISATKRARRHTNQVKELEELNQRQLDKVKDYVIAQLSDQLVVITERLQDLERKNRSNNDK
jgi:uncharacterized coiled-coil protein SlyX